MPSEAAKHSDFSQIRYAQCWEDADVLLAALNIQPGDTCLSIASAGDNTLSMLTADPAQVIAIDLNPSQLACLQLRVAAYRHLEHAELLELVGSTPSSRRASLYARCRASLADDARRFWDAHPQFISAGIGGVGKFEAYFHMFRTRILPLIHRRGTIDRLLAGGSVQGRRDFYESIWNNRRWRWLFKVFFSRRVMGRFGRSPAFFKYVEGSVADRILTRARHALTELNPADNPYLQWILTGRHTTALPHALRLENFDAIRRNIDCVTWRLTSLEDLLESPDCPAIHRLNLSDIFEYISPDNCEAILHCILNRAAPAARLAYWNMLVPRSRPGALADRLQPLDELAAQLHFQDKAFFYSRFIIEEVRS